MMSVFASIIHLTVSLEITQAVARFLPDMSSLEEKKLISSTALWFTIFTNSLFYLFAFGFSSPLSLLILGLEEGSDLFLFGSFGIICTGVSYFLSNQLRWQLQPLHNMISSLVVTLVSVSVTLILVVGLKQGVKGVFWGQIAGALAGSTVAFAFSRKSFGFLFSRKKLKEMIAFSLPLVPSSIGVFISLYIDRIAIRNLMTLSDVGIYGVGYRLSSVVSLLMVGVQGALMPLVYHSYKNPNTPKDIAKIFRFFVFFALVLLLGMTLFSKEVLVILTTPDFYSAQRVIPFLVGASLFGGMYIFAPGLGIAKKTKKIALLSLVTAILNSILNFLFIPFYGIIGAALATLLSMGTTFLMYLWNSNKYYRVPYEWKRIVLAAAIALALLIITVNIAKSMKNGLIIRLISMVVSTALLSKSLISRNEAKSLLKLVSFNLFRVTR